MSEPVSDVLSGYDYERAANDLRQRLFYEARDLANLVLQTAKSNIRYYPDVRNHLTQDIAILGSMIAADIEADHWQAWLEQFGKGSMMAGPEQNRGLITYMNSKYWNALRSKTTRIVKGRAAGYYASISSKQPKYSGGSYRGVDLEELAERGDIDAKFKPTPPTYFLRVALQSNKARILQGFAHVLEEFPYHKYFRKG
jgi:hypothetical protein